MPKPNMSADPAKARRVIEFMKRPENAGMNNREVARELGINESYVRRAKAVFRWGMTMKMSPKKLRTDGGTQSREAINDAVVAEYVEAWQAGVVFPPVDAFYDGTNHWLADGFHRVIAAIKAGIKKIDVEVHSGEVRDAVLFSVGANAQHGLRRTNADKRRAAFKLLNDEEWHQWSDVQIARRCGVSHDFIRRLRPESHLHSMQVKERTIVNKHGQKTTINTDKIGKSSKPEPKPEPEVTEPESDATPDDPAKVSSVESNGVHEKNGSEIARIPATPEPVKAPVPAPIPAAQSKAPEPTPEPTTAAAPAPKADPPKPTDPPDIAAQRAKGIIPKDAVVTVTEPGPADEDEPANVQEEQSDQEWLAECPAREKLSEVCRKKFDTAALNYRRSEDERSRHRRVMKQILSYPPGFPDSFTSLFNFYSGVKHPKHWVECKDCDGTGQYPAVGKCTTCHSRGYHQ